MYQAGDTRHGEDVHGSARDRIGHLGQVQQCLDRALTDLPPHPLVFLRDLLCRRLRRPRDADAAQIVEANLDVAVVRLHLKSGDGGQIGEGGGTACQLGKARFRRRLLAGQELAFGTVQAPARS